jgi:hypothetical protein
MNKYATHCIKWPTQFSGNPQTKCVTYHKVHAPYIETTCQYTGQYGFSVIV